jgi:hypothetical protein
MSRTRTPKTKVFGIGFHKTGTTSLARALRLLGYRVTGPNGVGDPDIRTKLFPMVEVLSRQFDAFQDNPWPLVYQHMDQMHPQSKFILTIRDPDQWAASQAKYFGRQSTPMRQMIYGVGFPEGNEEIYKSRMKQHNEEVIEYFKNRPNDLLVIDLTAQNEWEPICRFLDEPIPRAPFPHANQAKMAPLRKLRDRVQRLVAG